MNAIRLMAIVLLVTCLGSACSFIDGAETSWEPLQLGELTAQAQTATPAEWGSFPDDWNGFFDDLWPMTVPAPGFLNDSSPSFVGSPQGERSARVTANKKPDESDVVAYIALLLEEGFVVDERAALPGWFVRDGFEWIALGNSPTSDYLRAGDFSAPDPLAGGFSVSWTTNPVRQIGYCRIVEVGGETCRE